MELKFKIPMLPPSSNRLTTINYRLRRISRSKEATNFRNKAKKYIPFKKFDKDQKFTVDVVCKGKFYNKNGTIKKRDVQNFMKCLYDVTFECLGIDDSRIFSGSFEKVHSDIDETIVMIKGYNE